MFDHLIVDTGPILQGTQLSALGGVLHTVPEVLAEIRDEATRERLSRLPADWIQLTTPSAAALSAVKEFAKRTGDTVSLSAVDLRVIALTLTLEQKYNPNYALPTEPTLTVHQGQSETERETATSVKGAKGKGKGKGKGKSLTHIDDGWITPENLAQVTRASLGIVEGDEDEGEEREDTEDGAYEAKHAIVREDDLLSSPSETPKGPRTSTTVVGCISTDFAVQNLLLQMRLKAVGPEGYRIRQLKNWLLRCHACYWTTQQMERRFCDRCGGPTLIRTSYRVTNDGQVHLFLKKNFQYNNRGTMAPMPLPRGKGRGSNAEPPVLLLREDQKEYEREMKKYERQQRKEARSVGDPDAIDDRLAAVFGAMSVKGGSGSNNGAAGPNRSGLIIPPVIGFGRRNPNQARRKV